MKKDFSKLNEIFGNGLTDPRVETIAIINVNDKDVLKRLAILGIIISEKYPHFSLHYHFADKDYIAITVFNTLENFAVGAITDQRVLEFNEHGDPDVFLTFRKKTL